MVDVGLFYLVYIIREKKDIGMCLLLVLCWQLRESNSRKMQNVCNFVERCYFDVE